MSWRMKCFSVEDNNLIEVPCRSKLVVTVTITEMNCNQVKETERLQWGGQVGKLPVLHDDDHCSNLAARDFARKLQMFDW